MKKLYLLLLLISSTLLLHSQSIDIYGFVPNGTMDYLTVATIDGYTGQQTDTDTVFEVNAYGLGSSAFDDYSQNFIFKGVDTNYLYRLASWNMPGDSMTYLPFLTETVNDLQFDMNSLKLYGLGNYIVDSIEIFPGMYQYEYATRFLEIDQDSGYVTEYSKLPNLRNYPAGASTFDANGARYIVNGNDSLNQERIYIIDATSGQLLSELSVAWSAEEYVNELEYNNTDDKLYGLYRNLNTGDFAIISVNLGDNSLDTVVNLEGFQYFTQGSSVFHQLTQTFIMYYIDTDNVRRLLLVDVKTATVLGTPEIGQYFTEIEVDNNQFAMLAYHSLTALPEEPEGSKLLLKLYPNPASRVLNYELDFDQERQYLLEIRDISGRLASTTEIRGRNGTIDVSNLPAGIYFPFLKAGKSPIFGDKIIISK